MASLAIAAAFFLATGPALVAQETAAPPADDIASLRAAIDQQTRRIDMLTEQVARLAKMLEQRSEPAAVEQQDQSPRAESVAVGGGDFPPGTGPEPSRAGKTHVVQKGENLTEIAKQHGVTIDELAAANRIEDARKLQIGQVLTVPEPSRSQESTPKEAQ